MIAATAASPASADAAAPAQSAHPSGSISFHAVLSALNPLQYLPVIGTIYRAITGDEIPELVRRIGSLVVSTLLGGPIGAGVNLAMLAGEKASGIDLDKTGQSLLRGDASPAPASDTPHLAAGDTLQPPTGDAAHGITANAPPAEPTPQPWSVAQLAAYGVTTDAGGTMVQGALQGADVLNGLELSRLQTARSAYARLATPQLGTPPT